MTKKEITEEEFLAHYTSPIKFRPNEKTFGIELELVLFDSNGQVVPRAYEVAVELRKHEPNKARFKWEFFGGQLEVNTGVHTHIGCLLDELFELVALAQKIAALSGWHFRAVGYLDEPREFGLLDLTPEHLEPRYHAYAKANPHKVDAMCRVAAIQFQVGASSFENLIHTHDSMVRAMHFLRGERTCISQKRQEAFTGIIYPDFYDVPQYGTPENMLVHARQLGFANYLSGYYAAVRLNAKYATAEFRLPDSTLDRRLIESHLDVLLSFIR